MRIIILHNFYQHPGGEDTVVQQEAAGLSSQGHEVKIITKKNKKGIRGICQFILYPFNIFAKNNLLNQINYFKPDIIHIHNIHYAIGPLIIRSLKKKGYPIAMTLHNYRLICPSATLFYRGHLFTKSITENFPWTAIKEKVLDNSFIKTFVTGFTYWLYKQTGTWNLVDRYITLSEFSKNIFINSTLGLKPNKFVIKPNFVDNTERKKISRENHFIYIGRLSEEKGIIPLLQAISKTNYKLRIFGSGQQEMIVKEFANKNSNIEYLGFQNQEVLNKEISFADALIVPSLCYEGMPMTIIEAFSQGTAVLCSDIGILKQMVLPLYTGLHFDPTKIESIIQTLDEWANLEIEKKEIISKNCNLEFSQKYTMHKNIELLEEIYEQIIKENEYNNYRPS